MEEYRNPIILGCVVAYMVMCIVMGIWAMRRTKSTKDFFMAGRHLGVMVTALAVFSSTLSGFGFVGGPGLVYSMGMSSLWMVIPVAIGYSCSFFLLGKRLRLFAELLDSVSLPDVVAARYGSESSRLLTAIAILLGVFGYLATQILAMSTVLEGILDRTGFQQFATPEFCIIVSCSVLVFYCVTGGIVASVYTDVIQGSIMVVAALFVFFACLAAVDGGLAGTATIIMNDDPEAIGPWGTLGMMGCLSWYFLFTLGGAGQPHIITKMMMNKKISDARSILPVSLGSYTIAALLWIGIGLTMRALVLSGQHPELASADDAAPAFLQAYVGPVLAGIVFAGLFAAIMSTADGFLNIGAAALVHDIPRSFGKKVFKRELMWARIFTVIIAVCAAFFALYSKEKGDMIALLGAFGWGAFAAALVPTVAIGFNWKRANALAVNTAMVAGITIIFSLKLYGLAHEDFAIPYNIDAGAIALLVSLLLFFGISLAMPQQKIDPEIEAVMDI